MSENPEPVVSEQENASEQPPAPVSHRRILWMMAIIICAASLACVFFVSYEFGLGLAIGGVLAFVNYWWMKRSLRKIFDRAIESAEAGEQPRFLAAHYFLRYLGLAAALGIVYLAGVSIVAVLLGLCTFGLAVLVEGFLRIFSSISKREEF